MGRRRARRWWEPTAGALILAAAVGACEDDSLAPRDCSGSVERVEVEPLGRNPVPRVGGALRVRSRALDECDRLSPIQSTAWSASDPSVVSVRPITITQGADVRESPDEGFVRAVGFGSAVVEADVDGVVGSLEVEVIRPPTRSRGMEVLGADSIARGTTDLWVHGDYAYTGTTGVPCGDPDEPRCSSVSGTLVVWRLGSGGVPAVVDSVSLPGPRTGDVKVSPGGGYMVVSQESEEATNGIVVLDLANPAAPTVLAHFTEGLENGVHNLWIETIDGTDWAFVIENGGSGRGGVHVVDLSDPAAPAAVTTWVGGDSQVHDVFVRDGLAFVSHWDDGLFILDVGNGIAGGSPGEPVVVGSLVMEGGNTHNAWYWPDGELVFVGEERGAIAPDTFDVGRLHVVDVTDLADPREIATHRIPGETPHNFWLDEENAILYAAWYDRGVRALDVSGDLSGDLGAAGRELGFVEPSGSKGLGSIWAPQLHGGVLYLSDQIHGMWAVQPIR